MARQWTSSLGNTPRAHRFQLPMATRNTDVSTLHDCPGRWVLTHLRETEQAEASFFILGSLLHEAIERAILMDMDEDWSLSAMHKAIDRELERIQCQPCSGEGWFQGPVDNTDIDECPRCNGTGYAMPTIETSKRGFDTMHEDAERMLKQWFWSVHPDSPKRLETYNEYEWPPRVEVPFTSPPDETCTKYPVWGSIDAVFEHKSTAYVALVDWKSGTSKQRTDDQLHFYQFGIALDYAVGDAWFHHLDKVQKRSIIQEVGPWPGTAVVRQRILATEAIKDSIIEGEYPQFNPSFLCNYCPVQHLCPADGDARNREENGATLRRMLKHARPMVEIDREKEIA